MSCIAGLLLVECRLCRNVIDGYVEAQSNGEPMLWRKVTLVTGVKRQLMTILNCKTKRNGLIYFWEFLSPRNNVRHDLITWCLTCL